MHLANRAIRLVAVMAATAAIALTIGTSTAGAAVTAPAGTTPHSTTAHAAAVTTAKPQVPPPAPSGCNNGNLCEYNSGNGGNLCFQWSKSADWPGACAYHNEGEYNRNGNGVYLQGNVNGTYCEYLLYSGHYLLYNANDHFQGSNHTCTNATLEHKLYSNLFI
jgi:hypothetical protein